jgi:hypothetical protein
MAWRPPSDVPERARGIQVLMWCSMASTVLPGIVGSGFAATQMAAQALEHSRILKRSTAIGWESH